MKSQEVRAIGMARMVGRAFIGLAVMMALVAPVLDPDPRNLIWCWSGVVFVLVGLERFSARRWPGRPLSLLRVALLLACAEPSFLMLATAINGDARYATATGYYTHTDGAWLVALAALAINGAMVAGALLVGGRKVAAPLSLESISSACSPLFLRVVSALAFLHAFFRLVLLFYGRELPPALTYVMRLYLSLLLPLFVYLGFALRARISAARVAIAFVGAVALLVLLTGSRAEALYPLVFTVGGFLTARVVSRARLLVWATVGGGAFLTAMFIGDALRSDERGRGIEAALARADEISVATGVGTNRDLEAVSTATLRRMVSNSTHAVITRIPKELPFESDGVVSIPADLGSTFLPRLNYTGLSATETPRAFMLNQLGFLVSWVTFVELTATADAWYRGGFIGLIVVGALFGLLFQAVENLTYRAMHRRPHYSVVLVFASMNLLLFFSRDVVAGLRGFVFMLAASLAVVSLSSFLGRRKPTGSPHRSLKASAGIPRPI